MAALAAAAKRCMNAACGATAPTSAGVGAGEWRKGWPLRSGAGFAVLCDKCGYVRRPTPLRYILLLLLIPDACSARPSVCSRLPASLPDGLVLRLDASPLISLKGGEKMFRLFLLTVGDLCIPFYFLSFVPHFPAA